MAGFYKQKLRHWKVLLACGIIIILSISIAAYILMPRGSVINSINADDLIPIIKDGDLICRLGNRTWSLYFKEISPADKRFSHIGIIHIKNGIATVITAEGDAAHNQDYVEEVSLQDFLNVARSIGIYRVHDISGNKIAETALQYVGHKFDWQFDMNDNSEIYCTELAYTALQQIKPDIQIETVIFNGITVVPVEAFSNNAQEFEQIYYADK